MSDESATQVEERVSRGSVTVALNVWLWCLRQCRHLKIFELQSHRDRLRLLLILRITYLLFVFIIQKSV